MASNASQHLPPPARLPVVFGPSLIATLVIGMVIAALLPFDFYIAKITNLPLVRGALVGATVLAGAVCAQRAGLRLEGHGRRPVLLGVAMAVLVAGYVVLLDCFLFRNLLSEGYAQIFAAPLQKRLIYFMLRAFNENILYRLFAFSLLAYAVTLLGARRSVSLLLIGVAMVVVQIANIGVNTEPLTPERMTFAIIGYEGLRYIVPGVIWAVLFWRNGFLVAEIASVGCHLVIQPALGVLL
jgi:hypothetical protein